MWCDYVEREFFQSNDSELVFNVFVYSIAGEPENVFDDDKSKCWIAQWNILKRIYT